MTAGAHGWPVSRPALALRRAGLHETLLVSHRHTQLTQRTVASSRAKHTARFRATPQLSKRGSKPIQKQLCIAINFCPWFNNIYNTQTHADIPLYSWQSPCDSNRCYSLQPTLLRLQRSDPRPHTDVRWLREKQAVLKIMLQLHFTLSTFEMWKNLTKLWLWFIYVNTCIACPINQSLWC